MRVHIILWGNVLTQHVSLNYRFRPKVEVGWFSNIGYHLSFLKKNRLYLQQMTHQHRWWRDVWFNKTFLSFTRLLVDTPSYHKTVFYDDGPVFSRMAQLDLNTQRPFMIPNTHCVLIIVFNAWHILLNWLFN